MTVQVTGEQLMLIQNCILWINLLKHYLQPFYKPCALSACFQMVNSFPAGLYVQICMLVTVYLCTFVCVCV